MRDAYTSAEIANLVSLDVDAYTGDVENMEVVLTTRFERDVRRREAWTYYLNARGRDEYRREIARQVAEYRESYSHYVECKMAGELN
jgi:hypothetical protein